MLWLHFLTLLFVVFSQLKSVWSTSEPIFQSRCNKTTKETFYTKCIMCVYNFNTCPSGAKQLTYGMGVRRCIIRTGNILSHPVRLLGCSHKCERPVEKSVCCRGFWGPSCSACPGIQTAFSACYGNGKCNDGLNGNGTCHCNASFEGSGCENCVNKKMFGDKCQKNCTCQHGECSSGVYGNGQCLPYTCNIGYHGQNCHIYEPKCKSPLACGNNTHCVAKTNIAPCQCNPGYKRNDSHCLGINPCEETKNICRANSVCHYRGPGKHQCICAEHFTGDGTVCTPIDYCQKNNGNCSTKSQCMLESPGKVKCSCLPGYHNYTGSKGCTMIDFCKTAPLKCGLNAECFMVRPALTSCRCRKGYVFGEKNSSNCYGNIIQRLDDLNNGLFKNNFTQVRRLMKSHSSLFRPFEGDGPFTVFIPYDKGLLANLTHPQRGLVASNSELAQLILLRHVVSGYISTSVFEKNGSMTTLKGHDTFVTKVNGTGFFYQLRGQHTRSLIISSDHFASNGIIHILQSVAWLPDFKNYNYTSSLTIWQVICQNPKLKTLCYLIQIANLRSKLEVTSIEGLTFIAPTDEAFASLGSNVTEFLKSNMGNIKLKIILRHHIIGKKIGIAELITRSKVISLSPGFISITMKDGGAVVLSNKAKLIDTDIQAQNGVIHISDSIIFPSYVFPLIKKRCDENATYFWGPCNKCSLLKSPNGNCPDGTIYTKQWRRCFKRRFFFRILGCQAKCVTLIKKCCSGFYGANCDRCPGPLGNPCLGNGKCDDDINGDGRCICDGYYRGTACELCKNPLMYGPFCNQTCNCIHGRCDSGLHGSGSCVPGSCKTGYMGVECSIHMISCGSQTIPCSINGACYMNPTPRCKCNFGYKEDGANCYIVDPCLQPNRGGCSNNSVCTTTAPGRNKCTCNSGWTGDGDYCAPINLCVASNGGCHKNAKCLFLGPAKSDCECLPGYKGNGVKCDEINSCLIYNGGCSPFARCMKTGPGQNSCKCRHSYVGDGYYCVPSIALVMAGRNDISLFYQLIKKTNLVNVLNNLTNITVFAPANSAITKLKKSEQDLLAVPFNLEIYLSLHIATRYYTSANLRTLTEISSFAQNILINITESKDNQIYINDQAKIIAANITAANGIFHIIDKVILPSLSAHSSEENAYDALCGDQQLSEMCNFIKKYNVESVLQNKTNYYTIFAPTNETFHDLSQEEYDKINNISVKYHITEHFIKPSSIQHPQRFATLAGPHYVLAVEKHGSVIVNGERANHYRTGQSWVIYKTTTILKARKNSCFKDQIYNSACVLCIFLKPICPVGYLFKKNEICRMGWGSTFLLSRRGCRAVCVKKTAKLTACCPGFWGRYCDACPGDNNNPCSGNGLCQDGLNGNGACSCNLGFNGTACEKCEEGRYGENCKPCSCLNDAKCDQTNGFCICPPSWKGLRCENVNNLTSCGVENITCHQHASCNTSKKCQCDYGFEGNGTHCKHFKPCPKSCSPNAICNYNPTTFNTTCNCKHNYEGDGFYCQGKNLCDTPNRCHPNADCGYLRPGRSICECKPGYIGDGLKKCEEYNPCTKYKQCSMNAVCSYDNVTSNISCVCRSGYHGNGYWCMSGNLMERLQSNPDLTGFYSLVQNSVYEDIISDQNTFSVFAPINKALNQQRRKRRGVDSTITDLNYYVVGCVLILDSDVRKSGKSFRSVAGAWLNITSPLVINNKIKIISIDTTMNGSVIVVDQLIESENNQPSTQNMTFTDVVKQKGYIQFYELLKLANMIDVVSIRYFQPYTMLWPTDQAIARLPSDIQERLFSGNYTSELRSILRYHILSKQKVSTTDILGYTGGLSRRTDQGASLYLSCGRQKGDIYINDRSMIIERDIKFLEGIAFGISEVLLPPGIAGKCDEIEYKNVHVPCHVCAAAQACPAGSYIQSVQNNPSCYVAGHYDGCSYDCLQRKITRKCCKNFYGPDCQECPSGPRNPCSGKGFCNDGLDGNGTCACHSDQYAGTACEKCYDQLKCGVIPKVCKEPRKNPCSVHASCDVKRNQLCQCRDGYDGDGFYCQEIDLCQKNRNSGCHKDAICIYQSPNSVRCRCRPGFFGNGRICTPYPPSHPCSTDNGNCHYHADCMEKDGSPICKCRTGFVGNGIFCGGSVIQIIYDVEDLSEFVKVFRRLAYGVEGNDLLRALNSEMPYTVFAPLNYGFTTKTMTINELKSYIVQGLPHLFLFGTKETLVSVGNTNIIVEMSKNGDSRVNNIAKIVGQYQATNGMIYLIDHILPIIKRPITPRPTAPQITQTTKTAPSAELPERQTKSDKSKIIGIAVGVVGVGLIIIIIVVILLIRRHRRQPTVRYNKQFHSVLFESDAYDDDAAVDDYEDQELQHPSSTSDNNTTVSNPNFKESDDRESIEMMETGSTVPLTAHDSVTFG